jgi:hypothetical protein
MSSRASTELNIQNEVCKPRSPEISGATESDSGADTTKVIYSTPECEVRSAYRANTLMVVCRQALLSFGKTSTTSSWLACSHFPALSPLTRVYLQGAIFIFSCRVGLLLVNRCTTAFWSASISGPFLLKKWNRWTRGVCLRTETEAVCEV